MSNIIPSAKGSGAVAVQVRTELTKCYDKRLLGLINTFLIRRLSGDYNILGF